MTEVEIRPYWYEKEVDRLRAQLSLAERSIQEMEASLGEKYREGYDNALAEQHLDRAAIIEECARVAEIFDNEAAKAIRALKDKP